MSDWLIYRGTGEPHSGIADLPPPPSWRTFQPITSQPASVTSQWRDPDILRASSYRPEDALLNPVNAALYLRRPLLVTGRPGVGKSTLAYAVAYELGLGPVLRWPITSRSSLREGLYTYDAIGRLQDVNLNKATEPPGIDRYLRLGPLGTAMLPWDTPRALLIDEIDKADLDLPNDLLTVFEEGEYEITELVRIADAIPAVDVVTADGTARVQISAGLVRCQQFPFVVMTSNGEREFPPAFLRRCLRLEIEPPGLDQLTAIVEARLGPDTAAAAEEIIAEFHSRAEEGDIAIDQLLNAIHMTCQYAVASGDRAELVDLLLRHLSPITV